ncbi:hypothetical protein CHS0354_024040 [Potamilus streckersoni]|uniref:Magnesium transporter MgtE n=1 Tax=Potamilus streckersoni TaxID=2493646 RepID=A0AAE0VLB3_9BIVA|nr:hypothetical protein CHS0354_024040 [Potamilus streckersoni]
MEEKSYLDFQQFVKEKNFSSLRNLLVTLRPPEIADLIKDIQEPENAVIFRLLPTNIATEVFEYLDFDNQEALLNMLATEEVATLLNRMSPDDRTALLEDLPASVTTKFISLLSTSEQTIASSLLAYPENSIGRLMTPEFIAILQHWTVQTTLDHIRSIGHDSETLNVIYVVDEEGNLIDDIRIRELILALPSTQISSLMNYSFVSLSADQDQSSAIAVFKKYNRVALPVVNKHGILVGIVTIDDILAIAEEKSTDDMFRFGGTALLNEPYISVPVLAMVKKRVVWLIILFVGELFTAEALTFFEDAIGKFTMLALFIPLITSSGGNAGSQAATLIIRSFAIGELNLRDWWKVMKREVMSGVLLGAALGSLGFIRALFKGVEAGAIFAFTLGATIGISLVFVVLWGTIVGAMLPFLLRKLNFDPATSSGPTVATIVDISGIIIYFSIATFLLIHM